MKILIVEDNERVAQFLRKGLGESGHTVDNAMNGPDGLHQATHEPYDVLIVDRMLPGGIDGLEIIASLRGAGNKVPILILSALAEVDDRIQGLRAGGDDYLVKPFAFGELLARLDALARRVQDTGSPTTALDAGELSMNLLSRKVTRAGKTISLLPREFQLLEYMMRHADQVVTRTMLLDAVWEYDFSPQTNIIDVHVSKLRQKIDAGTWPMLRTIRNAGYMLVTHE